MPRMTCMMVILLLLVGCTQEQDKQQASPMLPLQLLLTQAANLAALPGKSARKHALELARRAMSGPEMNAMHHGGGAHNPMMKATHDLGDAVFEFLDTTSQDNQKDRQLKTQIQMAAQAAQMRLSGKLVSGEVGTFMQEQGKRLIVVSDVLSNSSYAKAGAHLLEVLHKSIENDRE